MGRNDGPHIFSARVADFDGVPIKKFAKGVLFGEIVVQNFEKVFAKLGFHFRIIGGVVPNYIFMSTLFTFAHIFLNLSEF